MRCAEDLAELAGEGERIQLDPTCHTGSSVRVDYIVASEALIVVCETCGQGVADIPVSRRRSVAQRKKKLELVQTPTVIQKMDKKSRNNRERRD